MIAGLPSEALKDFNGGVHLHYKLSERPPELWDIMDRALQCKGMIGCGTFSGVRDKKERKKLIDKKREKLIY